MRLAGLLLASPLLAPYLPARPPACPLACPCSGAAVLVDCGHGDVMHIDRVGGGAWAASGSMAVGRLACSRQCSKDGAAWGARLPFKFSSRSLL